MDISGVAKNSVSREIEHDWLMSTEVESKMTVEMTVNISIQ